MTFRDLSPWLIAPIALFAALPKGSGSLDSARTIAANNTASQVTNSAATTPTSPGQVASTKGEDQERLDCYGHDARHLLWDFANSEKIISSGKDEAQISVTGSGKSGKIVLNENIEGSKPTSIGCDRRETTNGEFSDTKLGQLLDSFRVRFLVATVPDPEGEHLGYDFDMSLEAIEAAIAETGHSLDRSDLPWVGNDPVTLASKGERKRDPSVQPGIMLFRGPLQVSDEPSVGKAGNPDPELDEKSDLLLVFVVGERPTSGLHKLALASALQQITELSEVLKSGSECSPTAASSEAEEGKVPCVRVGVLAPSFTGSVASLNLVFRSFEEWIRLRDTGKGELNPANDGGSASPKNQARRKEGEKKTQLRFKIVSGGASAVDQEDFLTKVYVHAGERVVFQRQPEIRFVTTTGYGPEAQAEFLRFLHEKLRAGPDEVAILRESNTAYGQSLAGISFGGFIQYLQHYEFFDPSHAESAHRVAKVALEKWFDLPKGEAFKVLHGDFQALNSEDDEEFVKFRQEYADHLGFIDLPFPLNISSIRTAPQNSSGSSPVISFLQNPRTLTPVLVPDNRAAGSSLSFGGEQDKPSAELVMSNLLSTIASKRVRYVGIAATDLLDTIYLAKQVHENCPDTTIFCFWNSLLFLAPDVSRELSGMLVVGTYPLSTSNQDLTFSNSQSRFGISLHENRKYHQFSSDEGEGVFNGTLALLDHPELMLDYDVPLLKSGEKEKLTAVERHPPIWVEAVGNDGLVPITTLQQPHGLSNTYFVQRSGYQQSAKETVVARITLPWSVTLLFWVSTAFCGWFVLATWLVRLRPDFGGGWWPYRGSTRELLSFQMLITALLVFYVVVSAVFWIPWLATCPDCSPTLAFDLQPAIYGHSLPLAVSLVTLAALMATTVAASVGLMAVILGFHQLASYVHIDSESGEGRSDNLLVVVNLLIAACLAASAMLWAFVRIHDRQIEGCGVFQTLLTALRYANPTNGYSPFPPLFFASVTILVWSAMRSRRGAALDAMIRKKSTEDRSYLGFDSASLKDIGDRESEVSKRLTGAWSVLEAELAVLGFLAAGFVYCFVRGDSSRGILGPLDINRSLEGVSFDVIFAALFLGAYCVVTLDFVRFVTVWLAFRKLLRRLSWHPLRESCAELGRPATAPSSGEGQATTRTGDLSNLSLASPTPTFTALEFSAELGKRVIEETERLSPALFLQPQEPLRQRIFAKQGDLAGYIGSTWSALIAALAADARYDFVTRTAEQLKAQGALAQASSILTNMIDPNWRLPTQSVTLPERPEDDWSRSTGLFLASRILDYSRHILAQLRSLLAFSTLGALVMLIAASSYPFPRSDTILRFGWMVLLVMVVIGLFIFVQMNRDKLLSLLSGGTPGKIDWNSAFFSHIVLYALLPVLTLLGIRFPATFSGIINSIGSLLPGAHP